MAKFSGKNIEFLDDQKAIFGSEDDSAIYWDGVDEELIITTVVSGIDPTQDGHLTTKRYVDTTVSGYKTYHRIHIDSRGLLGSGGDWADEGMIGSVPVIIFPGNKNTQMVFIYRATQSVDLSVNPSFKIATAAFDTAPAAGESVYWSLQMRYIAPGESMDKAVDETITYTQTLDDDPNYLNVSTRNKDIDFTLNKNLISEGDIISATLVRDTSNINDNFNDDFATSEIWFIYYGVS